MTEPDRGSEPAAGGDAARSPADIRHSLKGLRIVLRALVSFLYNVKRLRWRSNYYMNLTALCRVDCMYEVWAKIADNSPLDAETRLYKDAEAAVTHYLMRTSIDREAFGIFERKILRWNFALWVLSKETPPNAPKHFAFVRKHRLARIVRSYENIQIYINYLASLEVRVLEDATKEAHSSEFWRSRVDFDRLPAGLNGAQHRPAALASALRKQLRNSKRAISIKNYLKIDFTLSDLSAFFAVSGALLLILGFLRATIMGWYFGIPLARYFGTTDYIASGVGEIYAYLLGALGAVLASMLRISTESALSSQSLEYQRRTWGGRFERWVWHFTGATAILATAVIAVRDRTLDVVSLSYASMYLSVFAVGALSVRFFVNPVKGWAALTLLFVSTITTAIGTISEAKRLNSISTNDAKRLIRFADGTYEEPAWKVFALTSNFLILRRPTDGAVVVRNRADMKAIEDQP